MSVYCLISSGDLHFVPIENQNQGKLSSPSIPSLTNPISLTPSPSTTSLNSNYSSQQESTANITTQTIISNANIDTTSDQYTSHAVYLPQYSIDLSNSASGDSSRQIKEMLIGVFPDWEKNEISVNQLTGGITNMLLSCRHKDTKVLVRTYGKGTNLIIDRDREFISHLLLNSLNLAPKIYARFANGLVYGFLPGRSLSADELSNPILYPSIAQKLGNWHELINAKDIEDGINKLKIFKNKDGSKNQFKVIKNIWQLIDDWINIIPEIPEVISSFKSNSSISQIDTSKEFSVKEALHEELNWLLSVLDDNSSPTVVAHADLLSGNIIIPDSLSSKINGSTASAEVACTDLPLIEQNPIQFIDYEYMLPAPRGFDIANHLAEWQGFDCDRSKIPIPSVDNPLMITWAKSYLSTYENITSKNLANEISKLIDEIHKYFGLPGFYWGIWATIQSEISLIDFNYREYSSKRFQEYWDWKKEMLKKPK